MPEKTAKPKRARKKASGGSIVIEQYRSGIGCNFTHKRVLRALGFRRLRQKVTRPDNPAVRGMVGTIPHLVRIVEA
jgi:large subunit ribosomal protein L30